MKRIVSIFTVLILLLSLPVFALANSTVTNITDAQKYIKNNISGNTLKFNGTSDVSEFVVSAQALKEIYALSDIKYYSFTQGNMNVLCDKNNFYDFNLKSITFTLKKHSLNAKLTYVSGETKDIVQTALKNRYTLKDSSLSVNTRITFLETTLNNNGFKNGQLKFETNYIGDFSLSTFEFSDVTDTKQWYYGYINGAGATGIMNGVGDGKFEPKTNITRAQLCAMIVKATEHIVIYHTNGALSFKDVTKNNWHYEYVTKCSALGIVNGVGENKFNPNAYATRQEIATVTVRLLKMLGTYNGQEIPVIDTQTLNSELKKLYKDFSEIMDYAKDNILICNKLQIMIGDEQGFRPRSNITRAECAKIFYLIFDATNV